MDERIHPFLGGGFFRLLLTEGGDAVVTYEGLFAFCSAMTSIASLIVSIISLMIVVSNKKEK